MKLSKSDIVISQSTPVELFFDGIKAKATRIDYTNKIKKVLCEYLADILKGDPKKVEFQKNNPVKPKKGVKRQFFDADWQERANEFVQLAITDPKTTESILISLVQKLKERNQLPKTHPDYITSAHLNHSLKPIKKLFDMNNVPFSWSRIMQYFLKKKPMLTMKNTKLKIFDTF